jgi:hypothetical protein
LASLISTMFDCAPAVATSRPPVHCVAIIVTAVQSEHLDTIRKRKLDLDVASCDEALILESAACIALTESSFIGGSSRGAPATIAELYRNRRVLAAGVTPESQFKAQ